MTKLPLLLFFAHLANAAPEFTLLPHPSKLVFPAITEASGLAVSPSNESFFWIVNDSGGTPEIHLANTDGTPRGSMTVDDIKNKDWEDLASFTYRGNPYLLIADTGDNTSGRPSCTLFIVREPALPAVSKSVSGKIPVSWKIVFSYQEGPRDCEAVAVDSAGEKIILVSKRTNPPCVYELPLKPATNALQTAKKIGETNTITPGLSFISFGNQPTGMDISKDGSKAAIITYYGVFVFPRQKGKTWAEALASNPLRLDSHKLPQAESVAFSLDGKKIFAISEGPNSAISVFE